MWRKRTTSAVIEATVYGTRGGVSLRNVDGSFFAFTVERYRGTGREVIAAPPDAWDGRAAVAWAERLAVCSRFGAEEGRSLVEVADLVDRVYAR